MSSSLAKWMEPEQAHAGEVRKLSTLLEASQALSSTLDLKQGLHRVLEILGRHHGALRSTVVLVWATCATCSYICRVGPLVPMMFEKS